VALPYKILFFTVSFFLILGLCRTVQAETFQIDLDNDGVTDLKAFYTSNELSHTELDRNQDGQVDVWMYFQESGNRWDTRADYDEDYDGRIDEVFFLNQGNPVRSLADRDLDGLLEEEVTYQEGRPMQQKLLSPPVDPRRL